MWKKRSSREKTQKRSLNGQYDNTREKPTGDSSKQNKWKAMTNSKIHIYLFSILLLLGIVALSATIADQRHYQKNLTRYLVEYTPQNQSTTVSFDGIQNDTPWTKTVTIYFKTGAPSRANITLQYTTNIHDSFSDAQAQEKEIARRAKDITFTLSQRTPSEVSGIQIILPEELEIESIVLNEKNAVFMATNLSILKAVILFICYLALLLSIFFIFTSIKLETRFLILAGLIGLCWIVVHTPTSHPDESKGYYAGYALSNNIMALPDNYFQTSHSLELLSRKTIPEKYIYLGSGIKSGKLFETQPSESIEGFTFSFRPFVEYPLQLVPQAIGITIARLIKGNLLTVFYAARLSNLMFYLLCFYFGIKRISKLGGNFQVPLFAIGLMPGAIEMATFANYDCFGNGVSLLFISYVISVIFESKIINVKDSIIICISAICLAPFKVVYFPLVFLVLMIPNTCFANAREGRIKKIAVVAVSIAALAIFQYKTIINASDIHGNDWITYRLEFVMSHPVYSIKMFLQSMIAQSFDMVKDMIFLHANGWNDITFITGPVLILLLLSSLKIGNNQRDISPSPFQKIFLGAVIISVVGLTYLGELLHWTPYGMESIIGVQGRYFIPILPIVLFLIKNNTITCKKDYKNHFIVFYMLLHFYALNNLVTQAIDLL